jgi:hypothetical protein
MNCDVIRPIDSHNRNQDSVFLLSVGNINNELPLTQQLVDMDAQEMIPGFVHR